MKQEQLRIAAIEKLRADGVSIHEDSKTPSIVSAIEKLTGRRGRWLRLSRCGLWLIRGYLRSTEPSRRCTRLTVWEMGQSGCMDMGEGND